MPEAIRSIPEVTAPPNPDEGKITESDPRAIPPPVAASISVTAPYGTSVHEAQTEEKYVYWLPVGVRDSDKEQPRLCQYVEKGKGHPDCVRVPFNLYSYLFQAAQLAKRTEPGGDVEQTARQVRVMLAGISRIVRKFGPEKTEKLLTGRGETDEIAYVESIKKLEEVRAAIIQAFVEIMCLGDINATVVQSVDFGEENADFLREVLNTVVRLRERKREHIEFFGSDPTITGALKLALPRRIRESYPASSCKTLTGLDELDYVRTEAGLIVCATKKGGTWLSHAGNDKVGTANSGQVTITESLREIVIRALSVPDKRIVISDVLDGLGFHRKKSGHPEGGRPKAIAPYYLRRVNIDPSLHTEGGLPPVLVVPATPWYQGWIGTHMKDPDAGGLAKGTQAGEVLARSVNPVLRAFIRDTITNSTARRRLETNLRSPFSPRIDALEIWATNANDRQLMPDAAGGQFERSDYNDVVRTFCECVTEAAQNILKRTPGWAGDK